MNSKLKSRLIICVLLLILGIVQCSAVYYEPYDCRYFSVEYPSDWETDKQIDPNLGSIDYRFYKFDYVSDEDHYITISIFPDHVSLYISSSLNTITEKFDEQTMHFIDTLKFKI